MNAQEQYEERQKWINDHAAQLAEHFDSVLILVTVAEEGASKCLNGHSGNWFACKGAAHAFIEAEQSDSLSEDIASKIHIQTDEDD
jgi:hypothetical protein